MTERYVFRIRVDGGDEREFVSRHSQYALAVMEAFGVLGLSYPCDVEIWMDGLPAAGYGPYRYRLDDFVDVHGNRYGCPSVLTMSLSRLPEGISG